MKSVTEKAELEHAFTFFCQINQQLRRLEGRIANDAGVLFLWSYASARFRSFEASLMVRMIGGTGPGHEMTPEQVETVITQLSDLLFLKPARARGCIEWAKWRVEYAKTAGGQSAVLALHDRDPVRVGEALAAFEDTVADACAAVDNFWKAPKLAPPKLRLV